MTNIRPDKCGMKQMTSNRAIELKQPNTECRIVECIFIRMFGCSIVRLFGCSVVRLFECSVVRLLSVILRPTVRPSTDRQKMNN